jgi:hypothetical protein
VLSSAPAAAHDVERRFEDAADLPEVRRLAELHDRLHALLHRYAGLEGDVGRALLEAAEAGREVQRAEAAADAAQLRLDARIRAAYQYGAGGSIEALLGASTMADLAVISEYTARTISLDGTALRESVLARAVLVARRARAEAAVAALAPKVERLRAMLEDLQAAVDEATALAEQARIEDRELREQQRLVADAVARSASWDLGVIDYGADQGHLLALLGPTGGRTCETPPGLVETGEAFDGYASWYGWEFGGQPTATGAIFDPRLFTAANRWLPFGTFLRVRYGDRCALVLVNDRGPYGRLERVIDLSQAAAEYLGVGVSWVRAEILVPADGVPG